MTSYMSVRQLGDYKVLKVKEEEEHLEVVHKKEGGGDNHSEEVVYKLAGGGPPSPPGLEAGSTRQVHEGWLRDNIEYRPSDIVVATFPRCGTTWTEQIVLLLLNHGNATPLAPLGENTYSKRTGKGKIWPEAMVIPDEWNTTNKHPPGSPIGCKDSLLTKSEFDALPAPRLIKTHASGSNVLSQKMPEESLAPAKYIVVTRNMYDVCVSGYYHGPNTHAQGWPFEAWALFWLFNEKPPLCGMEYLRWTSTWRARWLQQQHEGADSTDTGAAEILWLHYEDMLKSPKEGIAKIARFIGINIEAQPDLVEKVWQESSFAKVKAKAQEAAQGLANQHAAQRGVSHYRKGKIGDWRSHFTPELEKVFREEYNVKLGPFGLQYDLGNGEILK